MIFTVQLPLFIYKTFWRVYIFYVVDSVATIVKLKKQIRVSAMFKSKTFSVTSADLFSLWIEGSSYAKTLETFHERSSENNACGLVRFF